MSDGPHRSLNMRPGWKKVAEFADNRVFTLEEIGNAAASALSRDWRADVPDALARCVCETLGGQRDSLFRDQKVTELEAQRRNTAGHELGQILLDCAIRRVVNGGLGGDAAAEAAADALGVWGARHGREVEEHYCRESTLRRAENVRTRIEEGIGRTDRTAIARQLLKLEAAAAPRTPSKQTGIDDGVQL